MTRIAYLVSDYAAPSHTFVRREVAALRRRGLTILPFSIRSGPFNVDQEAPAVLDAPLHRLMARALGTILGSPTRSARTWLLAQHHRAPGLRAWLWAQFHFTEALVLAAMLRAAGADRLHSHFANSGATVGMLAAHLLRLPWSLTLHGISETDSPAGVLLPKKIERADFVACASWFMRAQGMRTVPQELWSKFHIVRCGVALDSLPPPRSTERSGTVRFVTVGRLSAEKGHPGLLEALRNVIASGVDAELVIIGDGPLRLAIERQIRTLHLADRVILRGTLPELETLAEIAEGDIFVLASLMEGLPVVLMEAMALSKPVIAPSVAGIPELVRDNETGLLFWPGDWGGLAQCMRRVAHDAPLRQRLARASRSHMECEFDIERAIEPLSQLFGGKVGPPQHRTT
jgi:colanic acid/amylovoran biosynthesis glycosyltransferase